MRRKDGIAKFGRDKWDAMQWVNRYTEIGTPRHNNKDDGKVHGLKTRDLYISLMTKVSRELREHDKTVLDRLTPEVFTNVLERLSLETPQKELTNIRLAGEYGFRSQPKYADVTIPMVTSEVSTILNSRAYDNDALQYIHDKGLSEKHKLSFEVTVVAGLRAHEVLTLRPASEQPPSDRNYTQRFPDRPDNWVPYTVEGKGGLVTLKLLPPALAEKVEATRIPDRQVSDRKVYYTQRYDLIGGQRLSQAFTRASNKTIGFSHGLHGTRHTYAQHRMHDLARFGLSREQSLLTVSQEMGHLRPEITEAYLR